MGEAMRGSNKLTAAKVQALRTKGLYGDGLGLYLVVDQAGRRYWTFRYTRQGRSRELGLGPAHTVSLAMARERALQARRLLLNNEDPIDHRRAAVQRNAAQGITFAAVAEAVLEAHRRSWRNPKTAIDWRASLRDYAFPIIGDRPVSNITVEDLLRVLTPIWEKKPVTASNVRARVEAVLDYAKARGWRNGENAATWKGNLQNLLPAAHKLRRAQHHAALPWQQAPALMAKLRDDASTIAHALQFTILVAARIGEVLGATWGECDLPNRLWIIPAQRMKAGREHRVPLSDAALAIVRLQSATNQSATNSALIFPGRFAQISQNSIATKAQQAAGGDKVTVHGFRSTFRDWAADHNVAEAIAEAALAHQRGDATVRAYQRGDLLQLRREVMERWASYLGY